MRLGLAVSFFLHVALLAYALVSFASTPKFKVPEPDPVEVAIITEDGLTRLRQGDRASKLLEAKAAPPAPKSNVEKPVKKAKPPEPAAPPPEPEPVKAEPDPPPEPEKKAEPEKRSDPIAEKLAMLPPEKPKGPSPEELAKQEAEKKAAEAKAEAELKAAEAKKKADAAKKRKAAAAKKKRKEAERKRRLKKKREAKRLVALKRKRAAEQKKRRKQDDFFADMQKALKDNDPTKRAAPTGGTRTASNAKRRGPTAGAPEGTDTRLTASQSAMLGLLIKSAVKECWSIQTGAQGIEKMEVKLIVRLRPDGSLAAPPRVYNSRPGPLFADTANSAVRAVVGCANRNRFNFPPELYKGGWDQAIWTFDPSKMF